MARSRDYTSIAEKVLEEKFPDAACAFISGSVITGDDTPSSDIDLIVLYNDKTHETWRESIIRAEWPLEIFVHNLKSQDYFFADDIKRGQCSTTSMVSKGIIIGPDKKLGENRKRIANRLIAEGPEKWSEDKINWNRYAITDLFDDLRHPKDPDYSHGILAELLNKAGDFYLRSQGKWSGSGKQLVKILKKDNPEFTQRFLAAFKKAQDHNLTELELVLNEALNPYGGFLFENYKSISTSWKSFQE